MADRTTSYAAQEAQRKDEIATIVATIDRQQDKYTGILPSNVNWNDFRNAFLVSVQMNPRLLDADRQSLWLGLQRAASDGLKPDGREGALVIFGDDAEDEEGNAVPSAAKGKKKVVWMPMVAGLIKLVRNTGRVANIRAKLIYRGERVIITDEDGKETYKHVREIDQNSEIDDSPANIIGAFAVVNYKDGFWEMEPMSRRQIDRVKATSRAKKGSAPWNVWYDEMAKKTVLRRLIKRLDKSSELQQVAQALEEDATLNTIDGTAVEVGAPAAITQDQTIQQEFTAPKQRQPVEKQDIQQKPKAEAKRQQEEPKRQPDEPKGEPASEAKQPENLPTGGNSSEPIELWPLDEHGEPLESPEPMDAGQFADWFCARLFATRNANALIENNADNIADCRANESAFTAISGAIGRYHKRAEEMAKQDEPKAPPAAKAAHVAVVIPKTPKGAPHWPNYGNLLFGEIATLADAADIEGWIAVNKPNYAGKAVEIAVDNRLRQRRQALGLESIPGDPPQTAAPPADDAPPAGAMTDGEFLNSVTIQMQTMNTDEEITAWSAGASVRAIMLGLRKANPEMFQKVCDVIDARRVAVTPAEPEMPA